MISRGMGADCGDGLVHLEEFVEGASGLECSYLLKVLALEQQLSASGHPRNGLTRE